MNRELDRIIDSIESLLNRPLVRKAVDRLLAPMQQDRLALAMKKMKRKNAHITVIGGQGCGKSTLLSAVLFSRRILPEGESVTTSVLCFIHPADETGERCDVHFRSGGRLRLPLERASLDRYMSEANNPGNREDVESVHCYARSEMLVAGTVFVDTPGLGAIGAHDQGTMAFVGEISLGIYVLRGTSPMTADEVAYLDGVWKYFPNLIFVQNVWGDFNDTVGEILRENTQKIAAVARRHNDDRPIDIVPINIHSAAEEACNPSDRSRSGTPLLPLRKTISAKLSGGGLAYEIVTQSAEIIASLSQGIASGGTVAAAYDIRGQAEIEELRENLREAKAAVAQIRDRHKEDERRFDNDCNGLMSASKQELRNVLRQIHREYSARLQVGTGHAGIEDEFMADVRRAMTNVSNDFSEQFEDIQQGYIERVSYSLDGLKNAVKLPVTVTTAAVEDVSGERAAEVLGKLCSGVGGTTTGAFAVLSGSVFANMIVAGKTVAAATVAATSFVPVVGWVIAGTLVGLGTILKRRARDKIRATLLAAFARVVEEAIRLGCEAISAETSRCHDLRVSETAQHIRAVVEQKMREIDQIEASLAVTFEKKAAEKKAVCDLVECLKETIAELDRLLHGAVPAAVA